MNESVDKGRFADILVTDENDVAFVLVTSFFVSISHSAAHFLDDDE